MTHPTPEATVRTKPSLSLEALLSTDAKFSSPKQAFAQYSVADVDPKVLERLRNHVVFPEDMEPGKVLEMLTTLFPLDQRTRHFMQAKRDRDAFMRGETVIVMDTEAPLNAELLERLRLACTNHEGGVIVFDSMPDDFTSNLPQMLKEIPVMEVPSLPREKAWVEMNQPYGRKRKRARSGRKFK